MKIQVMKFALLTAFAVVLPLAAHAHKDADCDMKGTDMSKMSAEEMQKMKNECAAKEKMNCGKSDMDMSKMSDSDMQTMKEQCHKHDATHADGTVPATPATPATPADPHIHNGG